MAYSDLIPVEANTEYIIHGLVSAPNITSRMHEYDSLGNWIRQIDYVSLSNSVFWPIFHGTTGATTAYLRIGTGKTINEDLIKMEKGAIPTKYVPYIA
jgi:hypothetical protein